MKTPDFRAGSLADMPGVAGHVRFSRRADVVGVAGHIR
jgi:hypothetical protein